MKWFDDFTWYQWDQFAVWVSMSQYEGMICMILWFISIHISYVCDKTLSDMVHHISYHIESYQSWCHREVFKLARSVCRPLISMLDVEWIVSVEPTNIMTMMSWPASLIHHSAGLARWDVEPLLNLLCFFGARSKPVSHQGKVVRSTWIMNLNHCTCELLFIKHNSQFIILNVYFFRRGMNLWKFVIRYVCHIIRFVLYYLHRRTPGAFAVEICFFVCWQTGDYLSQCNRSHRPPGNLWLYRLYRYIISAQIWAGLSCYGPEVLEDFVRIPTVW